jgi:cell division protease FtsH
VEAIFGKRPWTSRAEELLEAQQRAEAERMAEERAKELEAEAASKEAPTEPTEPTEPTK